MLQYPLPLPPLSLTSSRKSKDRSAVRSNDAPIPPVPTIPHSALTSNSNNNTNNANSRTHNYISSTSIPRSAFAALGPHVLPRSPALHSSPLPSPLTPASNPVSLPGPSPSHPQRLQQRSSSAASGRYSTASSLMGDVLSPGDLVGEGISLQGEPIRLGLTMPNDTSPDYEEPAQEFEVVRQLGTGSYAVVYLVREVLSRHEMSLDSHMTLDGMELDDKQSSRPSTEYGRDFAIKCLSKANLDEEALAAQMTEVTIHQSLRSHPNIVTLHRTLETDSFLLLLLEFVPGEDLFYFLEQARDHYDSESTVSSELAISSSRTPPTPSLLSNLHPSQLLSRNRLRLIASMFSQMCDAVASCHDQQVFHRDIKPENFIVTDGWMMLADGRRERKVVVKLSDFGLSTTDVESSDMDCGSAPYMSYECRNNVAPTYKPRAADVWSLGIVLINMLYHFNPWQDTAHGACTSFDLFRQQPIDFFMHRFTGMTRPVAEFLAKKVFCILDDPQDDSPRVTAREFGVWVKDLPALLADTSVNGHKRVLSTTSTHRFPIALSNPVSRRPSSRLSLRPGASSHPRSRAPSFGPAEPSELPTVPDQEFEEQEQEQDREQEEEGTNSRSTSTQKRRKRGARKGKGTGNVPSALPLNSPISPSDQTLESLASASQILAREISKASRSSSKHRNDLPLQSPDLPPVPIINAPPAPAVAKKASKWRLGFGRNSSGDRTQASPVEEFSPALETAVPHKPSATANNVTNLIMGLNANNPAPPSSVISQPRAPRSAPAHDGDDSTWSRGRRLKNTAPPVPSHSRGPARRYSPPSMYAPTAFLAPEHKWSNAEKRAVSPRTKSPRAMSPTSTRSGRPVASSASSINSSNWRNSTSTTSSAVTSSSAFTRYSNNSSRSVSTQATSVSASSWRTQGPPQAKKSNNSPVSMFQDPSTLPPKNVKIMNGVPWELDQLPRGMYTNPVGDIFGSPPQRKARTRKPKDPLGTISERSAGNSPSASHTAEGEEGSKNNVDVEEEMYFDEDGVPKKVQKGQINALAKMLSALRR